VPDGWTGAAVDLTPLLGGSVLALAPVELAPVHHDLNPGFPRELAGEVGPEIGLVARHDEDVPSHGGILPRNDPAESSFCGALRQATDVRRISSNTSRGSPTKVFTTAGSKWLPAQRWISVRAEASSMARE
jgi:hypothetical protein